MKYKKSIKVHQKNVDYKILFFPIHGDETGKLVALEKGNDIPFEIKRVYYIWDTYKEAVRGKHAHRNLQQVIICVKGSCDFILDDGTNREKVHLDDPSKGLFITNNIWREFTNFSDDCVVMVLASEHYQRDDYILDYNEFISSLK